MNTKNDPQFAASILKTIASENILNDNELNLADTTKSIQELIDDQEKDQNSTEKTS